MTIDSFNKIKEYLENEYNISINIGDDNGCTIKYMNKKTILISLHHELNNLEKFYENFSENGNIELFKKVKSQKRYIIKTFNNNHFFVDKLKIKDVVILLKIKFPYVRFNNLVKRKNRTKKIKMLKNLNKN